ncbi:MAG TPA: hypothetical protein VMT89_06565 [Candidatus Acidoferrales bacterium]|nr:hypothetical protein [Candidatus Acidoferrales bacterium]
MRSSLWAALCAIALLCGARAEGQPLDKRIPGLFGGVFKTSFFPTAMNQDLQQPLVADRFRGLSAALSQAHSQIPLPSASGAFRFEFDDDLDSYVRRDQSLGPTIAERAQTLGARTWAFSTSYSRIDFDTLEGEQLSNLRSSQPALTPALLDKLPPADRMRSQDNTLDTKLNLNFGFDQFFVTAAYGVTDQIDASMSLAFGRVRMKAVADAEIRDPNGDGGAYFTVAQQGLVVGGSGPICSLDFRCAHDGFDVSKFGTGDLFLRSKWHFMDSDYADMAVAGVLSLPTGNADNYLGFHDPTFTPWFIASKSFGRFSPHLNLGYAFRSGKDVSQAQWIAGGDVFAVKWLTLTGDFLGSHDDKRDGINDDVLQSAVGFKINPIGQLVIAGTFQFPLNRDGLRADVIYSGQIEYAF